MLSLQITVLVLAAVVLPKGYCLECYNCYHSEYTSDTPGVAASIQAQYGEMDTDCKLNDEEYMAVGKTLTCESKANVCQWAHLEITSDYEDFEVTWEFWIRSCHYSTHELGCSNDYDLITEDIEGMGTNDRGEGRGCICDEDNCNSGQSIKSIALATMLNIVMCVYFLQ